MKITSCAKTDAGRKRETNQDHFLVDDERDVYVVADGVGGQSGGEVASALAVDAIGEVIANAVEPPSGRAADTLAYALRLASRVIHGRAAEDPRLSSMATTAVALRFAANHAVIANVGDSRAYRIADGAIEQITRDHSLVEEQVRAGILTREQARTSRMRNLILRSLGSEEDAQVDTFVVPVRVGDFVLLCSDGLTTMLDDVEIREIILGSATVESAVDRLIARANEQGGEDNVTVVLARVDGLDLPPRQEDERTPTPTPTPIF